MRTHARLALVGSLLAISTSTYACVSDSPTGGRDASVVVDSGGADSLGNDSGGGDGGGGCMPGCLANTSTLRVCNGGDATDTACDFGCVSTPTAHCGVFNPPGPVEPSDFTTANLTDVSVCAADAGPSGCSYVFHTDTGLIDGTSAIRPANASPTALEVGNGLGFRIASYDAGAHKVAIFSFKSLHVLGGKVGFAGPNPVAFVATNDIEIRGLVDMADTPFVGCQATAGGGAGGTPGAASPSIGGGGGGAGASVAGKDYFPGGGGGGSAGSGAAGGANGLGARGALGTNPALGTDAGSYAITGYGQGGNGASGSTPATAGQTLLSGWYIYYPGSGGGGVGRIGVGSYTPALVDGRFILSPTPTRMPLPIE